MVEGPVSGDATSGIYGMKGYEAVIGLGSGQDRKLSRLVTLDAYYQPAGSLTTICTKARPCALFYAAE